jgi:hypothetical protein
MPGAGYAPGQNYNANMPSGATYGYDADDDIRDNQAHVDNAYAVEHYAPSNDPDASEDDFGRHDFITLKEQGSKPNLSGSTSRHGFYAKSDGVYIEKDDATEIKVLDFTTDRSGVDADIPSGEILLFEKDTAVTGYTLKTDKDDMGVYITKGSAAGGETGATDKTAGTWQQADHTLTISEMPSHAHTQGYWYYHYDQGEGWHYFAQGTLAAETGTTSVNATGGGGAHNHGSTWRYPGRNFTRQQRN